MENVQYYRKKAEQYYRTAEYHENVELLREVVTARAHILKQLHVALDLEGALISNPLSKTTENRWDRLKRPLARELMILLHYFSRKLTVWTAAHKQAPRMMMASSGLWLPQGVDLVDRAEYVKIMPMELHLRMRNYGDRNSGTGQMIIHRRAKISGVIGADCLFDDNAELHQAACRALGLEEDAQRVFSVDSFDLQTEDALANHFKDSGLLKMILGAPNLQLG